MTKYEQCKFKVLSLMPGIPGCVLVFYLCNGPFDHRTACHTGSIDLLEIVIGIAQVACLHFFANIVAVQKRANMKMITNISQSLRPKVKLYL